MIRDMPAPRNSKEVKQFLGLAGYYRKFVLCFADLSRPLAQLTCKDRVFEWTHECKKAFDILKRSLCAPPILKYADTSKGYTLYTDASKYGWAGVLTQAHTSMVEGKTITTDIPVAYVSGLFRGSQLNWAALTKEAYAIYMSVKKLSFYLTDADILLKIDHLPLKKFLQKNTLNSKVNNWAMELEAFNIRFEHVSGKANILADTLSHLVDIDPDARLDPENAAWEFGYYIFESLPKLSSEDIVQICQILSGENIIRPDPDVQQPFLQQLRSPLTLDQLCTLQGQDDKSTTLMRMLKNGKLDPVAYSLQEGILYQQVIEGGQSFQVIYVPRMPESLIQSILQTAHDESVHNGFARMYSAIRRLYYWKGIKEDVLQHCRNCYTCQLHKSAAVKFKAKHFKPSLKPMDFIAMDLIGEFHPPSSQGNHYALTGVCMLTGFTWCIPINSKKATDVARAYMQYVYSVLGGSMKILTDNGTEFKNEVFYFPNMSAKELAFFLMYRRDPVNKLSSILNAPRRYLCDDTGLPDLEALKNMYQMVAQQLYNSRQCYIKDNKYKKVPDHGILVGDLVLVKDHTANNHTTRQPTPNLPKTNTQSTSPDNSRNSSPQSSLPCGQRTLAASTSSSDAPSSQTPPQTYLDNIIKFSQDESQHFKHLEIVFSCLWEAGLKMKHSKCDFFKSEIHYLGHLISPEGISPLPNKLDSIKHMPAPNSTKEIKQFLGLTGYYRKFVPRFADISRPLTTLTKKDANSSGLQHARHLLNY